MKTTGIDGDTAECSTQQSLKSFRAIAEARHLDPHATQHGNVQVAQRRVARIGEVPAARDAAAAFAAQQDREIVWVVAVAVGQAGAAHNHGVIEKGPFPFLDRLQAGEQVYELFDMPASNDLVRIELGLIFAVV